MSLNIVQQAQRFIIRNARIISDQILQGNKRFLIGKDQYEPLIEESICDLLMKVDEVERVAACEEGIYVFIH